MKTKQIVLEMTSCSGVGTPGDGPMTVVRPKFKKMSARQVGKKVGKVNGSRVVPLLPLGFRAR